MFERTATQLIAAAAACAAAVLVVFALGFALFALVEPFIGAAGGAASVAFIAALGIGGYALVTAQGAQRRARESEQVRLHLAQALPSRLGALAADRPMVGLAITIAAGALAARNPSLTRDLVALMTALDQRQS